ncbi:hypothetical protein BDV29DRAFT_171687 [Aspergillus leporis]|uniref:Uncharacterized protein n=1 Tax=Aspergillus leporis TaxID=41062 RepID=A0A5N5X4B3_9EURO|nr:hypothetical protein BDV29DRAFT_171687 [Aspergillus leporis]
MPDHVLPLILIRGGAPGRAPHASPSNLLSDRFTSRPYQWTLTPSGYLTTPSNAQANQSRFPECLDATPFSPPPILTSEMEIPPKKG